MLINFKNVTGDVQFLEVEGLSLEQLKDRLRERFGLTGDVEISCRGVVATHINFDEQKKEWINTQAWVKFTPSAHATVTAIEGGAKKRRSKKVKKTSKKTSKKGSKMMLGGAKKSSKKSSKKASKKSSKKASKKASRK